MNSKKKWLVIVNTITISRIFASLFLFPIYFSYGSKIVGYILAVFFLTDWIDGYLARKYNVSTFFGSIMDSVCDKIIMIVACTVLYNLNPYMLYAIICEVLIFIVGTINIAQSKMTKTIYIGKIKMWVLCLCVVTGFFFCKLDKDFINLLISIPAIIFDILTLSAYISKSFNKRVIINSKKSKCKSLKDINEMLFSPEFYQKHKDSKVVLDNIYEEGK